MSYRKRTSSQVRGFCNNKTTPKNIAAKRSDLQKRSHRDVDRPIITDEKIRFAKLAIETGFDVRTGDVLKAPLEPWLCPDYPGAIRTYGKIMRAPDGTFTVADLQEDELGHLDYMQAEQLVTLGPGGSVHALGDRAVTKVRYPGAPKPDKKYGGGGSRQLRGRATSLVLAAISNLAREKGEHVLALPAREVCAVANALKQKRPDLDGYSYLSMDGCYRALKKLRMAGVITMVLPSLRKREGRSWTATAAVYEVPVPGSVRAGPGGSPGLAQ